MTKNKDMANTLKQKGTPIQVNSRMIKNMGKEFTLLPMETSIQVNSGMV